MLQKLRRKFIILNMAMATAVVVLGLGAIGTFTYQQNVRTVFNQLEDELARVEKDVLPHLTGLEGSASTAAEVAGDAFDGSATDESDDEAAANTADTTDAAGKMPADAADDVGTDGTSAADASADDASVDGTDANAAADADEAAAEAAETLAADVESTMLTLPEIGGTAGGDQRIPVAVYLRTRDGSFTALPSDMSATLSNDVLTQAFEELDANASDTGTLSALGLFYQAKTLDDGSLIVAFADMGSASSWQALIPTLVVAGVCALFLFLAISIFFSRWALRPVEEAWSKQRRFVADASHDLKTPLTVILANNSILLSHASSTIDEERSWVESTQREARRMQHLVQELLELARIDEGVHAQEAVAIDFSQVVDGEVLQFESIAFERGIAFETEVEPGLRVTASTDAAARLVRILLDNACKYADPAEPVRIQLTRADGSAQLTVANAGPVIDAGELEHLFDRFYRADRARSRTDGDAQGHGLGLSIAHGIAEELGGSLAATSDAEHGTVFCCRLPIA